MLQQNKVSAKQLFLHFKLDYLFFFLLLHSPEYDTGENTLTFTY